MLTEKADVLARKFCGDLPRGFILGMNADMFFSKCKHTSFVLENRIQ